MEPNFDNQLYFWAHYKYAARPMCFVKLLEGDEKFPANAVVDILSLFDEWYGNTEQETTDWALEYQLLARMLLSDGALLVNTSLNLESECGALVPDKLVDILNSVSQEALHVFKMARALTQNEINRMYMKEEGITPSEMRYRRVMITRCGYAVVPGCTDQEALENAMTLGTADFDWERVDSDLIEETCVVIEICNEDGSI